MENHTLSIKELKERFEYYNRQRVMEDAKDLGWDGDYVKKLDNLQREISEELKKRRIGIEQNGLLWENVEYKELA